MDKGNVYITYMCVCVYIYTYNGLLLSINNNEILPFATMWMNLVDNVLSEISQKEKGNTV